MIQESRPETCMTRTRPKHFASKRRALLLSAVKGHLIESKPSGNFVCPSSLTSSVSVTVSTNKQEPQKALFYIPVSKSETKV